MCLFSLLNWEMYFSFINIYISLSFPQPLQHHTLGSQDSVLFTLFPDQKMHSATCIVILRYCLICPFRSSAPWQCAFVVEIIIKTMNLVQIKLLKFEAGFRIKTLCKFRLSFLLYSISSNLPNLLYQAHVLIVTPSWIYWWESQYTQCAKHSVNT